MPKNNDPLVVDGTIVGTSKTYSAVRKARAVLHERADEILRKYLQTIELATANGDFEAALKAYQWLIAHTPEHEGERIVDPDIDKQAKAEQTTAPSVLIGFQLGGLPALKALPEPDDK